MRNLEFDSRLLKLSPNPATVLKITKLCDKLPFAASYVGQGLFAVLAGIIILMFFRAPSLAEDNASGQGRPLSEWVPTMNW